MTRRKTAREAVEDLTTEIRDFVVEGREAFKESAKARRHLHNRIDETRHAVFARLWAVLILGVVAMSTMAGAGIKLIILALERHEKLLH